MVSLLLRALPVNSRKGRELELISVNHKGKRRVFNKQQAHLITSHSMMRQDLSGIEEKVKELEDSVETEYVPYANTSKHVLHVRGDRDVLANVYRRFKAHFTKASVPFYLKLVQGTPYTKLKDDGSKMYMKSTLEELIRLPQACLDIETNKKLDNEEDAFDQNIAYEEINTVGLAHRKDGKIISTVLTNLTDFVTPGIDIKFVNDWNMLPEETGKLLKDYVILHLHNAKFDLLQLRDVGSSDFEPGINESTPKITASADFSKRVEIKDYIVFDHYGLARYYMPWLRNFKAKTLWNALQLDADKHIDDYGELGASVFRAQKGDYEAAKDVLLHAKADIESTLICGEELLPLVFTMALAADTSVESVCAISPKTIGYAFWAQNEFHATKKFSGNMTKKFKEFSYKDQKLLFISSELPTTIEKGIFENVYAVYLNNLSGAFNFVASDKRTAFLKNQAEQQTGQTRLILEQMLDSICELPFWNLDNCPDNVFYAKYGQTKQSVRDNIDAMSTAVNNFLNANHANIINYSHNLILIKSDKDISEALDNFEYFNKLGKLSAVHNVEKGSFVGELDSMLITQGLDIDCRQGNATEGEKRYIPMFYERALVSNDVYGALKEIYRNIPMALRNKTISREDLLAKIKLNINLNSQSITQQTTRKTEVARQLGLEKGKVAYYGWALKNGVSTPVTKNEFLTLKPAYNTYCESMTGASSRLYKLVNSLFPSTEQRTIVKQFCSGNLNLNDWISIETYCNGKTAPKQTKLTDLF